MTPLGTSEGTGGFALRAVGGRWQCPQGWWHRREPRVSPGAGDTRGDRLMPSGHREGQSHPQELGTWEGDRWTPTRQQCPQAWGHQRGQGTAGGAGCHPWEQGAREGTDGHWESRQDVPRLGDIRGDTQGCRRRRRKTMPPVGTGDMVGDRWTLREVPRLGDTRGDRRTFQDAAGGGQCHPWERGQGRGQMDS